jgi:hypothetical protein
MDTSNTVPAAGRDCAELERTILQLGRSVDDLHVLVADLLMKNQRLRDELQGAKLNAAEHSPDRYGFGLEMKFDDPHGLTFESQ